MVLNFIVFGFIMFLLMSYREMLEFTVFYTRGMYRIKEASRLQEEMPMNCTRSVFGGVDAELIHPLKSGMTLIKKLTHQICASEYPLWCIAP
ncbi:hypothetical protein ED28_00045 [[Pantoea] beijingensis]|uniref:Uncharacterized protein n=1 Tax=[Pantoea] beijingensis TaxID=1324864 RepID=A0A443IH39_9GAMM|nr:hypothetical protein ED28_00045 [[Pantoea] beijingensis]